LVMKTDKKRINILGYDPAIFYSEEKIHHGTEHMEKEGYYSVYVDVSKLKEDDDAFGAAANWVVSPAAVPAAEMMTAKYGIPHVRRIPIGARSMAEWQKELFGAIDPDFSITVPDPAPVLENAPEIAVAGEAFMSMAIMRCLVNEFGLTKVKKYAYVKDAESEKQHREWLPKAQVQYFKTTDELRALIGSAEILVCDPEIAKAFPDKKTVEIPYPLISGEKYTATDYKIFGKKGAANLRMQISRYIELPSQENGSMGCMK